MGPAEQTCPEVAGGWKKKAGRGREIPEGTGVGVWENLLFWAHDRGGTERPGWSCSAFPLLPLQLLYGQGLLCGEGLTLLRFWALFWI